MRSFLSSNRKPNLSFLSASLVAEAINHANAAKARANVAVEAKPTDQDAGDDQGLSVLSLLLFNDVDDDEEEELVKETPFITAAAANTSLAGWS